MPSIRACASSGLQQRIESMSDFISDLMNPVEHIRADHSELTALRRDLHAHPELGFEEHRTVEVVKRELDKLSIEYHTGIGKTGVVAVIPGRQDDSGRSIGLRADMDALPMHEESSFPHVSVFKG